MRAVLGITVIRIRFVIIAVVIAVSAVIVAVALVVASAGAAAAGVDGLIAGGIGHLTTRGLLRCTGARRGVRIGR